MRKFSTILTCLLIALIHLPVRAAVEEVIYFQDHSRFSYDIKLLQIALDKTVKEYGVAKAVPYAQSVNEARGLRLLESGKVDVAFIPTNRERELRFRSVQFPLLQGLLGYRVLLIHKDNSSLFSSVKTLEQLRRTAVAGFGLHWADMQILYANQLPVIGHPEYSTLFDMLAEKRFDYFPRGLNEAWIEQQNIAVSHPDITIEQNIALYYPFPRYFFVEKQNKHLADRLMLGLKRAKRDGSFDTLFEQTFGEWIKKANIRQRHVIELNNPFLADGTPMPDTQSWH